MINNPEHKTISAGAPITTSGGLGVPLFEQRFSSVVREAPGYFSITRGQHALWLKAICCGSRLPFVAQGCLLASGGLLWSGGDGTGRKVSEHPRRRRVDAGLIFYGITLKF